MAKDVEKLLKRKHLAIKKEEKGSGYTKLGKSESPNRERHANQNKTGEHASKQVTNIDS